MTLSIFEQDILIEALQDIANRSSYEENPLLNFESSASKPCVLYDNIFNDGVEQGLFCCAHRARIALAKIGIDYKAG